VNPTHAGVGRRLAAWSLAFVAPLAAAAEPAALATAVDEAYELYREVDDGDNAQYIPALAAADPDAFGIVALTVDGEVVARGDTDVPFAIMSAAKPFALALLMRQQGVRVVVDRIGVEPTGLPFDSLQGADGREPGPLNPMVNAGAIITVSLIEAPTAADRWRQIREFMGAAAGAPLDVLEDVYRSVSASNYRNRALVNLLQSGGRLGAEPMETLDVYNRQSSVAVTALQLARMGATLANGGVNPVTGARVLTPEAVEAVLAIMLTSGFYDESGKWVLESGIPAKSGVGGGVVAVVPGRMALVGFSPRLSGSGNSVRGSRAIRHVAQRLGLSVLRP
jgi:glutaminase